MKGWQTGSFAAARGFLGGQFELHIVVSRRERPLEHGFVDVAKVHEGHTHSTPAALYRFEDGWHLGDEGLLLLDGELEGAQSSALRGEGGEDAVVDAEVGIAHVRAFAGLGQREGQLAKEIDTSFHRRIFPL